MPMDGRIFLVKYNYSVRESHINEGERIREVRVEDEGNWVKGFPPIGNVANQVVLEDHDNN